MPKAWQRWFHCAHSRAQSNKPNFHDMQELMAQEPELSRHMISVSKVRIERLRVKFKESLNDVKQLPNTQSIRTPQHQHTQGSARVQPSKTPGGVDIWRGVTAAVLDRSRLFSDVQAVMHAEAKAIKVPTSDG